MRLAVALLAVAMAAPGAAQDVPGRRRGSDQNDWEAYYQRGVELLRRRPRQSIRYFEHAARLEPMAAEPWLGLVAAFWRDHQDLARRRAERDPLIYQLGDVQDAEGWLDRAFALNPFAPLGLLTYTVPSGYVYDDRNAFARGTAAFLQNDFRRAAEELNATLTEAPGHWEAYHWRAMARVHLGDYPGAVRDLERMLEGFETFRETITIYGPTNATHLYYAMALLAARAGDGARARRAFERALTDDVTNAWAHLHFANMLWAGRDTVRALVEYAAAAEIAPDEPAIIASYGTALLGVGRIDEAVGHLDSAITLNPLWARPYYNRAIAMERLGRADEAWEAWGAYLTRASLREARQRALAEERRAALRP